MEIIPQDAALAGITNRIFPGLSSGRSLLAFTFAAIAFARSRLMISNLCLLRARTEHPLEHRDDPLRVSRRETIPHRAAR